MATSKIDNSLNTVNNDVQHSICEGVKSKPADLFENEALKRCASIPENSENEVQQLYDRMYHTHNRS